MVTKDEIRLKLLPNIQKTYNYTAPIDDSTVNIWHDALKEFTYPTVIRAAQEYFKNNTRQPSPAHIREIAQMFKKQFMVVERFHCDNCEGSGIVVYRKKVDSSFYGFEATAFCAARCACDAGNKYPHLPDIREVDPRPYKSERETPTQGVKFEPNFLRKQISMAGESKHIT